MVQSEKCPVMNEGVFLSFQKIIKIGSLILKLWLLKDVQLQPPCLIINCLGTLSSCHMIFFSNSVLKVVHIVLAVPWTIALICLKPSKLACFKR